MGEDDGVKIGLLTIWAIGVGAALGGDFFGWQFVLYGGFFSACLAVLITGIFYWLYAGAITELAARYKTTGGAFDFVKRALDPYSAAIMAILGLLKLIIANSANALAISSYLSSGGMPKAYQGLCWIVTYSIFTFLDCIGIHQSAAIQIMATGLCVAILLFYSGSTASVFKVSFLRNTSGSFSTDGITGFFKGLPFALPFFDGFEEVPLLMSYAIDPEITIPRAISMCYATVAFFSFAVLVCGTGASPTVDLLDSEAPLMNGIDVVYGAGTVVSDFLASLVVLGLIVNFFAFLIFTSQQVQAVSAAGQLPSFLAYRHPILQTPIVASVVSSIVGLLFTYGFDWQYGEAAAQNILVTAALLPAVLGYALLLECIVRTRQLETDLFDPSNLALVTKAKAGMTSEVMDKLGVEPGKLRFAYGVYGARVAQGICLLFTVGLLVLASHETEFLDGLLVVAGLGIACYLLMVWYILKGPSFSVYCWALVGVFPQSLTRSLSQSTISGTAGKHKHSNISGQRAQAIYSPLPSSQHSYNGAAEDFHMSSDDKATALVSDAEHLCEAEDANDEQVQHCQMCDDYARDYQREGFLRKSDFCHWDRLLACLSCCIPDCTRASGPLSTGRLGSQDYDTDGIARGQSSPISTSSNGNVFASQTVNKNAPYTQLTGVIGGSIPASPPSSK